MDETVIVIMIKEKSTGFLERELTSCHIEHNMDTYLLNAFATCDEGFTVIHLRLTVDGEFTDDEFNAIFDCYDSDIYTNAVCKEVEDCYNPTWELTFNYCENTFENTVNELLVTHKNEIKEVFTLLQNCGQLTQW